MEPIPNVDSYQLKPLDFSKYESGFHQHSFKLTKKNPFTTMTDEQWLEYISTHEAHFTDEPKYDIIPWEKLKQVENDASNAGWELILRTTNNTAYCPPLTDYRWYQRTQWIFGYPGVQLLLVLSYTENKFTLIKETKDEDIEMINYFSLTVVSTTKPKYYTHDDLVDYYDNIFANYDDDANPDYYNGIRKVGDKYYENITPATGWIMNGGMSSTGNYNFNYMFVGDAKPDFFGYYRNNYIKLTEEEKKENQQNIISKCFPPKFWTEWIDNNKDYLMPGKFEKRIQITHWDNVNVLPGGQCLIGVDDILSWDMSYKFIQKLMVSSINNWVIGVFGYGCCDLIHKNFWSQDIPNPWNITDYPELHKKVCILKSIPIDTNININNSENGNNEWIPFNGYIMSIFQQKEITFSDSAKQLIDEVWQHIKTKN